MIRHMRRFCIWLPAWNYVVMFRIKNRLLHIGEYNSNNVVTAGVRTGKRNDELKNDLREVSKRNDDLKNELSELRRIATGIAEPVAAKRDKLGTHAKASSVAEVRERGTSDAYVGR